MAEKYRTTGPDVMQPVPVRKLVDPLPPSRIPIFKGDHMVGHVGRKASSATVARFTGTHRNTLTKKNGRDAWIATAPSSDECGCWRAERQTGRTASRRQGERSTSEARMTTAAERERWRRNSLAYYYRQMETRQGRKRLAEYKRFRRRAIRIGIWPTTPEHRP